MQHETLELGMNYGLIYSLYYDERPYIQGFASEERRDEVFDEFLMTGTLTIVDEALGVSTELNPLYVTKIMIGETIINTSEEFYE